MFSNTTRIIFFMAGLLIAVFCGLTGMLFQMSVALLFMGLVVWGYFKSGTVIPAFRKLAKNDFAGAEETIRKTRYPRYLGRQQKAYYHLIIGLIEANKSNFILSAQNLEQALFLGLRTGNDRTVAHLNLAGLYYNMGDRVKAAKHLEEARSLNQNPNLETEIQRLSAALNT